LSRSIACAQHRQTEKPGPNLKAGATALELLNRAGMPMVAVKASDTIGRTSGFIISRRHTSPSVEKRCHDLDKIRYACNKVSNPFFEFDHPNDINLDAEITQELSDLILAGDWFLPHWKRVIHLTN
jgi:hypothetical protein